MKNNQKLKSFSLVEIIVAISFFALILSSISVFALESLRATENNRLSFIADLKLQEAQNSVLINKDDIWNEIVANTEAGPKHMQFVNNKYEIADGAIVSEGISTFFEVENVYRDEFGNIIDIGGTLDPHTRRITISAEWTDIFGESRSVISYVYVNNWNVQRWRQTTQAEFDAGNYDDTRVLNNNGGEIELVKQFFPDWCRPSLSITEYDIVNQAKAKSIFATEGHAFLGTGGNSAGTTLTKLNINGYNPPVVTTEGVLDGFKVNEIYVQGNYAYMSTDTNDREMTIVNVTAPPYSVVGYYNAPGSENSEAVFVKGNYAYVGQGNDMRIVDVSSPNGNRPQVGTIEMGWWFAYISHIIVIDNFAYVVMDGDWYELVIVDVSNPANPQAISYTSVNNQQVKDLWMSADATRAYFGTNQSSYEDEFWILDTTEKSGTRPVVGSYNTSNFDIEGIAIIEADERAIIAGHTGSTTQHEYRVLDISDETNPTFCGGLNVTTTINDLDSVTDSLGNTFSYVMTDDANSEFKIIRGGPGGGDEDGIAYISSGEYTSDVFDTGSDLTSYLFISWAEQLNIDTNVRVQVRAGASADLSGQPWVGPDGTTNTFFEDGSGGNIPTSLNNNRYIQYRVYLNSDNISFSPLVEEVSIYYQTP